MAKKLDLKDMLYSRAKGRLDLITQRRRLLVPASSDVVALETWLTAAYARVDSLTQTDFRNRDLGPIIKAATRSLPTFPPRNYDLS